MFKEGQIIKVIGKSSAGNPQYIGMIGLFIRLNHFDEDMAYLRLKGRTIPFYLKDLKPAGAILNV